jgi:nucleoside-diphosphate-sugar epimerase
MVRHLNSQPEWDVIAVSRRTPDVRGGHRHVAVDLLDSADTQAKLGGLREITHVFYSAYVERQPWAAMVEPNVAMLTNVLDTVEAAADHLRHVNLVHGTKWYGNHLGPFKTPAQESDARHMPPNFYYDQQALVEERRRRSQWAWSSARPHGICGFAVGNPMNLVMVLAVYATVSKALGLPLRHPGSEANAAALYNVTDSSLLARACQWMATEPTAANEPFNITNGDVFRWRDLWPAIANYFDMPTATAQRIDLVEMMADKAPLWEQLTAQHDLLPIPYRDLVGWGYGNFVFTPDYDVISSTTKARLHGFAEVQDTQAMFLRHFDELRRQKVIP